CRLVGGHEVGGGDDDTLGLAVVNERDISGDAAGENRDKQQSESRAIRLHGRPSCSSDPSPRFAEYCFLSQRQPHTPPPSTPSVRMPRITTSGQRSSSGSNFGSNATAKVTAIPPKTPTVSTTMSIAESALGFTTNPSPANLPPHSWQRKLPSSS